MKNFLKKYWFLFFLVMIVALLVATRFFLANQTKTPAVLEKIPTPKFVLVPTNGQSINYQFNFSLPTNFPQSLPTYKISSLKTNNYPEIQADLSGQTVVSSDTQAVETTKSFLISKGLTENLLQKTEVSYLKTAKMNVYLATDSAEIDIYNVSFWPQIDGITIVPNQPHAALSNVWLGKNGKIQKALATSFSLKADKTFSLRPLLSAQQDILQQKGSLVWLDQKGTSEGYASITIESLVLENVSLAYFLPTSDSQLLEPIYIFEGKAVLQNEEKTSKAAVYLPAIEEKDLQP